MLATSQTIRTSGNFREGPNGAKAANPAGYKVPVLAACADDAPYLPQPAAAAAARIPHPKARTPNPAPRIPHPDASRLAPIQLGGE